MHSGYPLMAHLDQQANLVNTKHLRSECNWGFYHEVGHNHQVGDWTFDGTVEVTVNLFTLYVYEFLCGIPVAENDRGSAAFRAEQMASYDFANPDFEQWKREAVPSTRHVRADAAGVRLGCLPGSVRHIPRSAGL